MANVKDSSAYFKYLDFQAAVGITKHNGGFAATDELLALCHIADAREVLEVGCGIGVGPCYLAKKHGCHVVGVDISEKMLAWSRLRAREERVEDRVEFQLADVLQLPFEELRRVVRPGGYVGLNESFWKEEPPADVLAQVRTLVGPEIPITATWQALWEGSGLQDRVVRLYDIDLRREVPDRMQWVGRRWAMRGFVRLAHLYLTRPEIRQSVKQLFGYPPDVARQMGYGLFVGRKQTV
jgi:SAM-dependent methyltransferase